MIAQSLIEKRQLRDYTVQRTATMTAIGFLFTVKFNAFNTQPLFQVHEICSNLGSCAENMVHKSG